MPIVEPKKSKRGRPPVDTDVIRARVQRSIIDALDRWIADQPDPRPSRSEAIRIGLKDWLIGLGLMSQYDDVEALKQKITELKAYSVPQAEPRARYGDATPRAREKRSGEGEEQTRQGGEVNDVANARGRVRDKSSLGIVVSLVIPLSTALAEEPKFSAEDVLLGVVASQDRCSGSGMVWVEVDGKGDCLRFYGSAGSLAQPPLIHLEGDVVRQSHPPTDPPTWEVIEEYRRLSPAMMQLEADQYSAATARTFILLGRPGVYGSSGNHLERRQEREVALVDGAIDLLKKRFGWSAIDLSGLSGGGHLVAALMARRNDIGCAVIGSGNVAVRQRLHEWGLVQDVTGHVDFVDPIEHVDAVALHPPRKVVVLTDPNDRIVSATSQGAYVSALRASGVAVEHRFVSALGDPNHHYLRTPTIMAALACHSDRVSN